MQDDDPQSIIEDAIRTVKEQSPQKTDGRWLEDLTVDVAPHIKDWDVAECWRWDEWPDREKHWPETTAQDIGIDCVAVRRSDNEHIAIQCKSRQLKADGHGAPIHKAEIDKFMNSSSDPFWEERWIVTNGDNQVSSKAKSITKKPLPLVNIWHDLLQQRDTFTQDECPHCEPNPDGEERKQSKSCMQNEAIDKSVRILREHELSDSGGLPKGQARGKIILPCGTGKTRISLRIVEKLTPNGELSIVLCPSIALVAQIRREYLQNAEANIRALAVCSDDTAGYDSKDPKKEDLLSATEDPTVDKSNVRASEVKGNVTTDPQKISAWIRDERGANQINVIFGTYQSGSNIAEALKDAKTKAVVLIADEAHRTAGLRRIKKLEKRIRDFTLCHNNDAFPATYRIYQTATPRIYDDSNVNHNKHDDWLVRTMDNETVFGVELYRKSYVEAVKNGWLADYRIVALGINDQESSDKANLLATSTNSTSRHALTTSDYLRGMAFALAMGGTAQSQEYGTVPIKSCIAFMNTVEKSKKMAQILQTDTVRNWLRDWSHENSGGGGETPADYTLEHLDATDNVAARDNAKRRLAEASADKPHGIVNVGIFGEGTDAPSLSAVAFLEARKSPIDVIQAVGRAMRTAPGKKMGYIICPIEIPPNTDPEQWLKISSKEEGWQELGQILQALRAHDERIEDNLADLLQLYIPKQPESELTMVGIADSEDKRIHYKEHEGPPGEVEDAVERVLNGRSSLTNEFRPISQTDNVAPSMSDTTTTTQAGADSPPLFDKPQSGAPKEPDHTGGKSNPASSRPTEHTRIVTGKKNDDGSNELRMDTVVRTKPTPNNTRGKVDVKKSKARARAMINKGEGTPLHQVRRKRRPQGTITEQRIMKWLDLTKMGEHGNAIKMNLLAKSGLIHNRILRDLNILETSVKEAARHLSADVLQPALDRHFGLNNLKDESRQKQANGCTIAALLMMNAAMLHQRIASGKWIPGLEDLATVKNSTNVVKIAQRQWHSIMHHDFRPVLEPAVKAIEAVEDTGKLAGLERALHHITAEAERIAETYADMGADHAGPLFNSVMGNQASDGAYFTRPVAASIAARLTLDVSGKVDWKDPKNWQSGKIVDLACGSGTLLAAILTDMKRRARDQGASEKQIANLQRVAVEETIKGLDINAVSLQLAASQLTTGNQDIRYRQMGLHRMPYGPQGNISAHVSAGTLELLGQTAIVPRDGGMDLGNEKIASQRVWEQHDDTQLEDAVDAAKDARIIIMNPPFTNRSKMGEKFPKETQQKLRSRTDTLEQVLVSANPELEKFTDKNALRPLFVALADKCLAEQNGTLAMIQPTVALTAPSGQRERTTLAQRYHIHTVLTCHQPGNVNMSQHTAINESITVAKRMAGPKPPTRFIILDRMPTDDTEVADLHECLARCSKGVIPNGWGEVSEWPAERIEAGDWTQAVWRSPELANAAAKFANDNDLQTLSEAGLSAAATGRLLRGSFSRAEDGTPGSFPILKSKSASGQTKIQSRPDEHWMPKKRDKRARLANGGSHNTADKILEKAGYLLITTGQNNSTARLTATADDSKYVGNGWMPIAGASAEEAKAIAVFINSTAGRLQLMSKPGSSLVFPTYSTTAADSIRIPDIKDDQIRAILADCWEQTKDTKVPQFRDGECEVRRLWDEAVAKAMGWDPEELARLRNLLHNEPHVRGLGYNEYGDEDEADEV